MRNATLKGLLAHKLRLALTALAIVLGVGFVAGTYVLTDTINATFTTLFGQITQGTDASVRSRETTSTPMGEGREPIPVSMQARVEAVDGVEAAQGSVTGYAQLSGKNGRPLATSGAPSLGQSFGPVQALNGGAAARQGRLPNGPGEIAIDARTAEKAGYTVGDRVKVLLTGPPRDMTIVGILTFGQVDNLGGASLVGFDVATAQDVLDREGVFDSIDVTATDGISPEQLRDRLNAALGGDGYEAVTGETLASEINDDVAGGLSFLSTAMLVFAGIALFVGAFLIYNTFSIIVAQRTRELALLRCLGASRRQVLGSVLTEALLVALAASVVGIGFGILTALGLRGAFDLLGFDLPEGSIQLLPRTIIVSLAVGVLVTCLSAFLPALKATRVAPVAAMREQATGPARKANRVRTVLGVLVTALGAAGVGLGLGGEGGNSLALVGAGAAVALLGAGILSPLIAGPLAGAIGWPASRLLGLPGKLARANATRNPRRTAATASALMIGLALVTFTAVLASSMKASTDATFDRNVAADYQLRNPAFMPFSPELAGQLREQPELAVAAVRLGGFGYEGPGGTELKANLAAVDPLAFEQVVRNDVTSGRLADLADGGVAVSTEAATANGWKVGSVISMELPNGTRSIPVEAVYADKTVVGSDYLLSLTDYERGYPSQADQLIFVKAAGGVTPAASRAAVERVTANWPNAQVSDAAEAKAQAASSVDSLLGLIYVLLGLAVVIALIGIVNTLALSIHERVRELGLLRAVGMDRRAIRSMIRWESVVIAVLGAVLGLVTGVASGWAIVRALESQGITELVVPAGQLAGFVVFAAVAGVLAAVLPGRRAAKVDVLRALAAE